MPTTVITKDKLLTIIKNILKTETDISFLLRLEQTELETLTACIRDRVDKID